MKKPHEPTLQDEAKTPRVGFLIAAGGVSALALTAYLFEETIITTTRGGSMAFAVILIFLVLLALVLVLCYRNPRIGNRLLGYDVVIVNPDKKIKSDVQYSGGFKSESGLETKRMNSKRKQARYSRRKLAETTRQMQQEKPSEDKKDS
ncbi:hypothetical protein [Kordiimonas pumila]|uniref:Uncharacterized protein n=1 Tax=Kordiimonas pumila TaxID=2161677 RepID=A0ABV7D0L7_9PROT|nr:hypothetical protein [Kordiimonas pumila]